MPYWLYLLTVAVFVTWGSITPGGDCIIHHDTLCTSATECTDFVIYECP